ncbi:MAG TPA: AAA family ATPase [Ktedonobacteraceae bacterium]|jgi:predicted kinase
MNIQKRVLPWTFPGYTPDLHIAPADWFALLARFSWLRALDGVPQDATYHAEGDVLRHTQMVVQSLPALSGWRTLAEADRPQLFAAALLHDTGKSSCTVVEADGRITTHGHARRGEQLARCVLWLGEELEAPVPFLVREKIAALVRLHGLPLQFLEKADPASAVIEASLRVRLDHLALLAEADVRGRTCVDQHALLERIALFRDYCQEQNCYTHPRAFASAYSRFVYVQGDHSDPAYVAYDDTCCEVVVMSGLPGAGKDSWIRTNLPDWPVISLDGVRRELGISPGGEQGRVAQVARERARVFLRRQCSFIWNATNVTRMMRQRIIDLACAYRARVRIVYVESPYAVLLSRNRVRQASVPEELLSRLLRKLEVPQLGEAQQVEWIWSE